MANILKDFVGTVPEVPVTVSVEDKSIIRIGIATVLVVTICVMIAQLINRKK